MQQKASNNYVNIYDVMLLSLVDFCCGVRAVVSSAGRQVVKDDIYLLLCPCHVPSWLVSG